MRGGGLKKTEGGFDAEEPVSSLPSKGTEDE